MLKAVCVTERGLTVEIDFSCDAQISGVPTISGMRVTGGKVCEKVGKLSYSGLLSSVTCITCIRTHTSSPVIWTLSTAKQNRQSVAGFGHIHWTREKPFLPYRTYAIMRFSTHALLNVVAAVLMGSVIAPDPPTSTPGLTAAPISTSSGTASPTNSGDTIPSSAPAGGITITQPVQTAQASYYKLARGVDVTFGWNFTSVLQYPKTLTVQAYCSDNLNTYNIATNLPGTATSVVWSPYNYSTSVEASNPNLPQLIAASYRLMIYDERGTAVGASPGLMQPNTKVQFALYNPQAYTPLASGWICAACNGAGSLKTMHPALLGLLATFVVAALSGWSVLSRVLV